MEGKNVPRDGGVKCVVEVAKVGGFGNKHGERWVFSLAYEKPVTHVDTWIAAYRRREVMAYKVFNRLSDMIG
jgi:hypothetical protein